MIYRVKGKWGNDHFNKAFLEQTISVTFHLFFKTILNFILLNYNLLCCYKNINSYENNKMIMNLIEVQVLKLHMSKKIYFPQH